MMLAWYWLLALYGDGKDRTLRFRKESLRAILSMCTKRAALFWLIEKKRKNKKELCKLKLKK